MNQLSKLPLLQGRTAAGLLEEGRHCLRAVLPEWKVFVRRTVLLDSTDVPAQGALGDIGVAGKIDETVPATGLRRLFHGHLRSPRLLTTLSKSTVIVVNGTRRSKDYAESVYRNNSSQPSNSLLADIC
jgi:hypothetical protein